jgi:hypothetical protein
VCRDSIEPLVSRSSTERGHPKGLQKVHKQPDLTARIDGFAREAIDDEATRLGVPVEELVTFSVLYYLADIDSGRIARQITTSPLPGHRSLGDPGTG